MVLILLQWSGLNPLYLCSMPILRQMTGKILVPLWKWVGGTNFKRWYIWFNTCSTSTKALPVQERERFRQIIHLGGSSLGIENVELELKNGKESAHIQCRVRPAPQCGP